ncbi:MAG TPA: hypothetical protein VE954_42135 [Oligoflexus sp.]|uniref:hypothetical protein n=1 Tax=Oligoflexus sp. TaxID=1971216 RepID=UPI002D613533|nr:hypothetical protein [Oligoflexus sp.]HYX39740.1 hypothetical protein [Oligoflexus sp.]
MSEGAEKLEHEMEDTTEESGTESLLDERIEVSPLMELTCEFGTPIWIRKSSVISVKASGRYVPYRSSFESKQVSCTIFTTGGEILVSHDASKVLEALGQGEL